VPTGGAAGLASEETNENDVSIERRNTLLGYAGTGRRSRRAELQRGREAIGFTRANARVV
jgi:hypothetical protein